MISIQAKDSQNFEELGYCIEIDKKTKEGIVFSKRMPHIRYPFSINKGWIKYIETSVPDSILKVITQNYKKIIKKVEEHETE